MPRPAPAHHGAADRPAMRTSMVAGSPTGLPELPTTEPLRRASIPAPTPRTDAGARFSSPTGRPNGIPAGLVGRTDVRDSYPEINRHLHRDEYVRAVELADELSLRRLDRRSVASGHLLAT